MPTTTLKLVAVEVKEVEVELTEDQRGTFLNKCSDSEIGRQFEIRGLGVPYIANYTNMELRDETRSRGYFVEDHPGQLALALEEAEEESCLDVESAMEDIYTAMSLKDDATALELMKRMIFATLHKVV